MKTVFEREWELYRRGGWMPAFIGETARGEGDFDPGVKAGEIRIFADMPRPFVALVTGELATGERMLVPVSPFSVPASSRELLVGERVFQLWNACPAAKAFTDRSWLVATLSADETQEIAAAVKTSDPGRIRAGNDAVAAYEREFLVSGGSFIPLVAPAPLRVGRFARYGAWSIAAMLVVCLGATWMLIREDVTQQSGDAVGMPAIEESADVEEAACEMMEVVPAAPEPAPMPEPVLDQGRRLERLRKMREANMDASPRRMKAACERAPVAKCLAPDQVMALQACFAPTCPETERYAEYVENSFRNPVTDPLSTFGLDVDTASYTKMRRFLTEQKRLPPKESVRLEEYVNYFDYDYPEPQGEHPIAVRTELAACPWAKDHQLLRIALQAKKVETKVLPPANLVFLLDCSGSMSWNGGFEMLQKSMHLLVDQLRDEDHVSIVTYASGTRVALPSVSGREKARIHGVIDSLQSGGGTNGEGGIQLAYEEAVRNFDAKGNNRVVLMTDGDFNVGISTPKALEDFIATKRATGVFLSVMGVGRGNYQDAMMKKLANAGNGNYAYIDSLLEAKKVMITEFGGSMFTVAKDVKLQLEFNPAEVSAYRLLGYESRKLAARDFNDDRKDAGEMGAGHHMTAFYEIVPAGVTNAVANVDPLRYQASKDVSKGELATVKLRYKDPKEETSRLMVQAVKAVAVENPSEDFRFASAVAEYALILARSEHKGSASFKALLERARGAKGADLNGYRAEFIRLAEQAELLLASQQYTVKPGDTLWRIAERYLTTVDAIKSENGLKNDILHPGQRLTLPKMD